MATLRTLIEEMIGDYLEEADKKMTAGDIKTNDDVHKYLKIRGAEHDGDMDRKTSAYTHYSPKSIGNSLKKAGWNHTEGTYEKPHELYSHPDGHTSIKFHLGGGQMEVRDIKKRIKSRNPHDDPNYFD